MEGGSPILPLDTQPKQLPAGDRLWLYAQEGGEKPAHCPGVQTCSTQLCVPDLCMCWNQDFCVLS